MVAGYSGARSINSVVDVVNEICRTCRPSTAKIAPRRLTGAAYRDLPGLDFLMVPALAMVQALGGRFRAFLFCWPPWDVCWPRVACSPPGWLGATSRFGNDSCGIGSLPRFFISFGWRDWPLGQPSQFAEVSTMVGLSVPLMSIAAQLPLWIARQMFGWRLIRGEENDGTAARRCRFAT